MLANLATRRPMRPPVWRTLAGGALLGTLLLILAVSRCQPVPAVAATLAQGSLTLVNQDRELVERRDDGGFVARPIFDPRPDFLAYGVKDPQDGSWVTAVYLVGNDPRKVSEGWEYTIEYPTLKEQPPLDRDRAYILALFASHQGEMHTFEATVPIYQPSGLWDRILNAFNPATWARALARWVVEGVHGLLCSVVERVAGSGLESCRE
jgi:hypothetical protein